MEGTPKPNWSVALLRQKSVLTSLFTVLAVLLAAKTLLYLQSLERQPVDLALRWWDSKALVEGSNYFLKHNEETYPPSFLLLMRPFIGWPYALATWIWTGITLFLWSGTVFVFAKTIKPDYRWLFLAASLALPSFWQGVGVGQFAAFCTACLMLFLVLNTLNTPNRVSKTAFILLAIAYSAGKFSLFLPVLLYLALERKWLFPVMGAALLHIVLLGYAAFLLNMPVAALIKTWMSQGSGQSVLGSSDWFRLADAMGIGRPWNIGVSMLGAAALAGFLRLKTYPEAVAIAVLLIFGRFWMYHAPYDNVMLLPAVIILYAQPGNPGILAMVFLGSLFIPARLVGWNHPVFAALTVIQAGIWIAVAAWLIKHASDSKHLQGIPVEIQRESPHTPGP